MYSVKEHFLYLNGKRVAYLPSPNRGGRIEPTLIVIHYTGDNSPEGALSWLTAEVSQVSAHLVIDKLGKVYQLVPFNRRAFHAGVSEYKGRDSVNGFSIGIENVGFGDEWPDDQVSVLRDVLSALSRAYKIENIVGHSDVAPGRKVDPGPRFPWDKVTDSGVEPAPEPIAVEPAPLPDHPYPAPIPEAGGVVGLLKKLWKAWVR